MAAALRAVRPIEGAPHRYCVPLSRSLSPAQRHAISDARDRLAQILADEASSDALALVLGEFLEGFRVVSRDEADVNTEAVMRQYIRGCRVAKLPLGAVVKATDNFRSGSPVVKGWNLSYRPTPALLVSEAQAALNAKRLRLVQFDRVLNAEPVPDPPSREDRAAVAARLAEFHAEMHRSDLNK